MSEQRQTKFEAVFARGAARLQSGDAQGAERLFAQALEMAPLVPEAHLNHGLALKLLERPLGALASYDRALALRPDYANAHLNRGTLLAGLGRWAEALASCERAVALKPKDAGTHFNRASVLASVRRFAEAIASFKRALALQPGHAEALSGLAGALQQVGRSDAALAAYERAIALLRQGPLLADCLNNRAGVHRGLQQFGEAMAGYQAALACDPAHAEARFNLGLTQLLLGDWANGWDGYALRWRRRENALRRPEHPAPEWMGETLAGKRLLLFGEQGSGDIIQCIRYVPQLLARGAAVTVLAPARLQRLLGTVAGNAIFVDGVSPDEPFDFQMALMDLPRVLGVRPDMTPAPPYLRAEKTLSDVWRARLGSEGFRIGLCWQGNPDASIDAGRSVPLAAFAPLAKIGGVRLISLQKVHGLAQMARAGFRLETPKHGVDDGGDAFVDTAAMMMNLDLVVTSDTAVAHLAGALGRPVWLVLKDVPDWRWLLECGDSPWYPTMRLFRQARAGDWQGPVRDVCASVEDLIRQRGVDGESACA